MTVVLPKVPVLARNTGKHPVSQRNGGNLIKLRRAKLRSQNLVTSKGDQVPTFQSDFLAFPCLEMVPKEICSVTSWRQR